MSSFSLSALVANAVYLICTASVWAQGSGQLPTRQQDTAAGLLRIGTAGTGVIKTILVRPGRRVGAGDILATLDCEVLERRLEGDSANLLSAEAVLLRLRNGARPEEIAAAVAAVNVARARAEEAEYTLQRLRGLQEGVTISKAQLALAQRDARVTGAQRQDSEARLNLVRAGTRSEEVAEAEARRNAARALVGESRARLEQCTIRAPVDGTIREITVTLGQFLSAAVPTPVLILEEDAKPDRP